MPYTTRASKATKKSEAPAAPSHPPRKRRGAAEMKAARAAEAALKEDNEASIQAGVKNVADLEDKMAIEDQHSVEDAARPLAAPIKRVARVAREVSVEMEEVMTDPVIEGTLILDAYRHCCSGACTCFQIQRQLTYVLWNRFGRSVQFQQEAQALSRGGSFRFRPS